MKKDVRKKGMDLSKGLFLLMGLLFVAVADAGAQTKESPWIFENGKSYEITSAMEFQELYARFTAETDGLLVLSYSGCNPMTVFTDAEYTTEMDPQPERMGWTPIVTEIAVTAGTTYYFYEGFVMNTGSIAVEFDSGESVLELASLSPKADVAVVVSRALFTIGFNKNIECDSVILKTGTIEQGVPYNINGTYLTLDLRKELMEWFTKGYIEQGSKVQLELQNVRNTRGTLLFGEDGRMTLDYVMAAKPMQLLSATNTPDSQEASMTTLPSYLSEDTYITMTFDAGVACDGEHQPTAVLMYGDQTQENGYYYKENLEMDLTAAAEGVIRIGIGGKLRRVLDMIPHFTGTEDEKFTTIDIKVGNICSLDGEYAYSPGDGTLGSYTFHYDYKELNNDVVAEITPRSGTAFNKMTGIEYWIRGEGISFDGVRFEYTSQGVPAVYVLEKDRLTIVQDSEDAEAVIMTFDVPQLEADAGTQVVVSLENLRSTDGLDYSSRMTVAYIVEESTDIDVVPQAQERVHVYALTGVEVLRDAPREALGQLKKGMYIVNGKKWMKR